jgi:hypothetical protein
MSRASRRAALAAAKDAKMKKVALVAAVVLLGVLGFQAPKILHLLHGSSSPTAETTASSTTSAATTTAEAAPVTTFADDVPISPGSGQLVSFELFRAHDPFVQQLTDETTPPPTTSAPAPTSPPTTAPSVVPAPTTAPTTAPEPTAPATTTATTAPTETAPEPTLPVVPPATTPTTAPAPTVPPPTSVAISTNGECEVVAATQQFPAGAPLFQLVSIAADGQSVQIGIANGSLEGGAPTVKLMAKKPVTLVDTANGIRYSLQLVAACPAAATTPAPTTTAP